MSDSYTSLVAYSKVGQSISYRINAAFFGFRIWQKSYSTNSKVILKNSFCKKLLSLRHLKDRRVFVEFNSNSVVTF